MKPMHLLILASTLSALASCTTRTVVYRRAPQPTVVTRTVYREAPTPATLPGQASRLPEPGAPSNFKATSEN